jgi:DNA-directed RNA polymerase, mitochondrial
MRPAGARPNVSNRKHLLRIIDGARETAADETTANDPPAEELARAAEKFEPHRERAAAQAITREWLPELAKGIQGALDRRNRSPLYGQLLAVIRDLDPQVLALCFLQGALHSIGQKEPYRDTALAIGRAIGGECWAAGLTKFAPLLAKRIEKRVRQAHLSSMRRQQDARARAARAGYRTNDWSIELRLQAGSWAIDQLLTLLPDVFMVANQTLEKGSERTLTITEEARAYADNVIADLIRRNPVWLPTTQEPPRWTNWNEGGTSDKRLSLALFLVRSHHKRTAEAVREAIRNNTMQPALSALNRLQSTAWKINSRVLDVLRSCEMKDISVSGVPRNVISFPEKPADWADMRPDQRRAFIDEARQAEEANLKFVGACTLFSEDIRTAQLMTEYKRFWTPMNLDWRGRVNGVPNFNFQREDRVRALFLFADGEAIGDEGLYWLKVHLANCGDFDRISKRPFGERAEWVNGHLKEIDRVAAAPLKELWWTTASKPFLFLAACFELSSALAAGPAFVSRLPISFDGTCSGLQHLSAMTRDEETAKRVNLTPQKLPQDIYQDVADRVKERIESDLATKGKRHLAQMCLDYIWDPDEPARPRMTVKRNVMTYAYNSKVYGMTEQLREDMMRPLSLEALRDRKEHPFGPDGGYDASAYLARHTLAAIEEVVHRPAQAMAFLQNLVRAVARENKLLRWRTPAGVPWINLYYKPDYKQIKLWLHNDGVKVRYTTKVAVGNSAEIDKNKAVNGVSPNFVHACDAAHLLRTVNAAVAEGIRSIATVHDSFGCLPSRAARFRRLIREEFVRMYQEHDVLHEVFEQARADLNALNTKRMPVTPPKGTLDIKEVLHADFAFA